MTRVFFHKAHSGRSVRLKKKKKRLGRELAKKSSERSAERKLGQWSRLIRLMATRCRVG